VERPVYKAVTFLGAWTILAGRVQDGAAGKLCVGLATGLSSAIDSPMTRFFALFFSVLVIAASRAFAADPFTVGGIEVDATAASAIEAQTKAIQDGQLRAALKLIDRVTLASERAANPVPELTPEIVGRMIRALEVGQERRSANRYLGEITVAFNPSQVQEFLRVNNLTLVSSQARERLVLVRGSGLRGGNNLQSIFADPRFSYALTPFQAASAEDVQYLSASPSDADLKALAAKYGLNQVLIVEPSGSVTDISVDTGNRNSFFISPRDGGAAFADAIVARLEADWKQASAIVASEVVTTSVSVLYSSHSDWLALQEAINTSAQIKGARLDALSKDGALMTISYGGDIDRMANELRFKGVRVEQDPKLGLVFKRS